MTFGAGRVYGAAILMKIKVRFYDMQTVRKNILINIGKIFWKQKTKSPLKRRKKRRRDERKSKMRNTFLILIYDYTNENVSGVNVFLWRKINHHIGEDIFLASS